MFFVLTTLVLGKQSSPVDALELNFLVDDLVRKDFLREDVAEKAVREYRRFLGMVYHDQFRNESANYVPGFLIDQAWHRHIQWTERYWNDSLTLFGMYPGHVPTRDAKNGGNTSETDLPLVPEETVKAYHELYNEVPDVAIWDWAQRDSLSEAQRRRISGWQPTPLASQSAYLEYLNTLHGGASQPKLGKSIDGCLCCCKSGHGNCAPSSGHCCMNSGRRRADELDLYNDIEGEKMRMLTGRSDYGFERTVKEQIEAIESADLSFLNERLVEKKGKTEAEAALMVDTYRDFLVAAALDGSLDSDPGLLTAEVELMWEMHILFTAEYREFSRKVNGHYLHHTPTNHRIN